MPKLDRTGPEGDGSQSGRKLGKCSTATNDEKLQKTGQGMRKKCNSGGGKGKRKHLKSGK